MPTRSELATELFNSGFNCSQSVAAVFSEKYGLPQSMALNVASGFGGGVRCGENLRCSYGSCNDYRFAIWSK